MTQTMIDAILRGYMIAKPHLMEELPDNTPVQILVRVRLGELRGLERADEERLATNGQTILSGG